MAHLDFNALKGRVENDYGPFVVSYGDEDDPKEVKFNFFIATTPDKRRALVNFGVGASKYLTGQMSHEEAEELFESGEDGFSKMVTDAKEALRDLSTNKTQFNAFAKQVPEDFIIWASILNAYFEHYGINGSENANDLIKGDVDEDALGEASPSQTS